MTILVPLEIDSKDQVSSSQSVIQELFEFQLTFDLKPGYGTYDVKVAAKLVAM